MTEAGEVGAEASGQASARVSACSKERRAAELLGTTTRRKNDGERDYGDGAAAVASAMAWEREGEELGANGGVQEGRDDVGDGDEDGDGVGTVGGDGRAAREGSRTASSCMARAGAAVKHLPACLA